MIAFEMPSLGADMEAGTLREWRKKPGDKVKRGDIIADVETQKGIIEIEVFSDGVIDRIVVKENEKVPVGTIMAYIRMEEEKAEDLRAEISPRHIRITPLAKKMALENEIDILSIHGSGEDGAITKSDIEKLIHPKTEEPSSSIPAENMRLAIATVMSRSNQDIPHYYLETRIDMSKALKLLEDKNRILPVASRLLPVALLIKATALALKDFPDLNAIWQKGIIRREKLNIGIVTSLRRG